MGCLVSLLRGGGRGLLRRLSAISRLLLNLIAAEAGRMVTLAFGMNDDLRADVAIIGGGIRGGGGGAGGDGPGVPCDPDG